MVLILLIFMWAAVLLPPYLKDRRTSTRPFSVRGSAASDRGSAQRFLPLEQLGRKVQGAPLSGSLAAPSFGQAPTGALNSGSALHSNVVQLRPELHAAPLDARPSLTAATPMSPDEAALHEAWNAPSRSLAVAPSSVTEARERRRTVLLALTGFAVVTLLLALMAPGRLFITAHILADLLLVGFAILLVRHRQIAAQRLVRVEPIRPPVTVSPPVPVQLAPSYLVSHG